MSIHRSIIGDRVRLRGFRPGDVADVFAYTSDPEVSLYLDWEPHRTEAETALYVGSCIENGSWNSTTLAIEHLSTKHVIGSFELRIVDQLRRVGEIGYSLAPAFWGQGYNLEAGRLMLEYGFGDMKLLRIQALCDVANRRSYRTLEKLGMVRERVLPRTRIRRNGLTVDSFVYGLLWREWASLRHREERRNAAPGRGLAACGA